MEKTKYEKFWETLCSLPGTDLKAESEKLGRAIKYPRFIYRYRSVSSKSLEALRTNKLYFSTANYYDDPFDTFLHIDIDEIRNVFSNVFQTPERMGAVINTFKLLFEGILTEEQKNQITVETISKALSQGLLDNFLQFVLALRNEVKKDIWSVCFSENGFNEVLWLKYADQYRGFVQIYDLENNENFLCGKQEKCADCGIRQYGAPLYPIYYSDKPYDATSYAKLVVLRKIEEQVGQPLPQQLYEMIKANFWEQKRITLVKKKCHHYDEEWRMIANYQFKPPVMREWIPSGVILGLRMDPAERNLVISMAKEAGIKGIYRSYINSCNKLDAKPVSAETCF